MAPTWRDVLDIAQLADRPNFGLCLDTFQTAGYEYGDPSTPTGRLPSPKAALDELYRQSLAALSKQVPKESIYILQISDAHKPPEPLTQAEGDNGPRPRSIWSSKFRPMPGSVGGYLPVVEMARAVAVTGYRGRFSVEIFDGGPDGEGHPRGDLANEAQELMKSTLKFVENVMRKDQTAKGEVRE